MTNESEQKLFTPKEWKAMDGVYGGDLIKDYGIDCDIPDINKWVTTIVAGRPGELIRTEYNTVLLCALPKSGSQHTYDIISKGIGYARKEIGFNFTGGKFYFPRLLTLKYLPHNTISHCHVHRNADIENIIHWLDLKVLVHTRNLLDALASRRDRMYEFYPKYGAKKVEETFFSSDNEYQLDVVTEVHANEYISFVTGWDNYEGEVMRTTYEEMVADEAGLVERVADWLGDDVIDDIEVISKKIKEAGGINFNKGVIGRGKELFNKRQKDELRRRADILGCDNDNFLGGL